MGIFLQASPTISLLNASGWPELIIAKPKISGPHDLLASSNFQVSEERLYRGVGFRPASILGAEEVEAVCCVKVDVIFSHSSNSSAFTI